MKICPDEGTKSPLMSLISVDLLPPLEPKKPDHPAGAISRPIWSSAVFAEALADVLQTEQGIGCLCHEFSSFFGQKQPDTIVFLIAEMSHPRQKLTDLKPASSLRTCSIKAVSSVTVRPLVRRGDNQTGTLQLGEGFLHGVRIDACLCSEVADTGKPGSRADRIRIRFHA